MATLRHILKQFDTVLERSVCEVSMTSEDAKDGVGLDVVGNYSAAGSGGGG